MPFRSRYRQPVWLAAGVRTPFAKVDSALAFLSQSAKELAARPAGTRDIVSICADGGQGSVALLEAA